MARNELEGTNSRIRVPKTSEIVADQIRGQIVRGDRSEGEFLPPEGQLMETLGISRPTLREAFRILEAEGLISVIRGSRTGARVHKPSADLVARYAGYVLESQGTTIADLYHARLAIEPSVVRWLTTDQDRSATVKLRNLLAEMRRMIEDGHFDEFIQHVEVFHGTLVASTNLKTLTFLNRMLSNLALKHQVEFEKRHPRKAAERNKAAELGYRSYCKLVELIEAGDVEAAVEHWRLHLRNANKAWTRGDEGSRVVDSIGG
ncbi:FadR/GntR family transcriptional regulator [Novosphingobium sp. Gsoil 351]|uniref:FadR/GntR family transcriptional regulator n=1 Tax=Novosphingobium sp. Gsoil 351 TaxID=2675225 RepID=UPI0012B501D9|nr:GntR family transcriptional regulator [Novosphingobium sp. Gsoil 351]QGN54199.1 GntR family transcriptional regulator [Novosphingobium sp. Gsoil 351]